MNLIEEGFQEKEEKKKKTTMRIVLVAIIFVVFIIIGIVAYMVYIQSTALKLTIDGQRNENLKQLLVFEDDGKVYVPIKEVAKFFSYESFDGEYNGIAEEKSKCYIQNENEIANFTLGSNKIYKLDISNNSNNEYEYVYSKDPVKAINGVLYGTTEAIEKAFNVSFQYDQNSNTVTILTMPYLIQAYEAKVLDFGYVELSDVFANNKTVLQNMLVAKKDNEKNKYGVIDIEGNIVLEPKYDSITYLANTGDFLVQSNEKVGIISSKREVKVPIMYSSIDLMDSDAGLYVVKNDSDKYGVIDTKGNIKIYIENDEIGIDISKYKENNIKSRYILVDNLIPAKKGDYWALYDKYGKQVVDYKYDSLGYTVSTNKKDALNLLVIPNYNVIVACKDEKYTLLNSVGEELFPTVADDIFMTISGGQRHYYIAVNDEQMDAEKYLDQRGVTVKDPSTSKKQNSAEDNNNSNTLNNLKSDTSGESDKSNEETQTNPDEINNEEDVQEQQETEESQGEDE